MGASRKCPDMVSGRMGASRDRAAGEPAGYARTQQRRVVARPAVLPRLLDFKELGERGGCLWRLLFPAPSWKGGSSARAGDCHPRACAPQGCLTRSARPAARVPPRAAQGRPLLKLNLPDPGGSLPSGAPAWSVSLSHRKSKSFNWLDVSGTMGKRSLLVSLSKGTDENSGFDLQHPVH